MKTILKIAVVGMTLALTACRSVQDNAAAETMPTNKVTFRAFQDERYIWENWQYSTNRANAVIK